METVKLAYKMLLIAAIVVYVIGVTIALSDLYKKVGTIEHTLCHIEVVDHQ